MDRPQSRANHLAAPQGPGVPPAEIGRRLAVIPRGAGHEVRISLNEIGPEPAVAIRLWTRAADGGWWPNRRGMAVLPAEVREVIAALERAEDLMAPTRADERPIRRQV